MHCRVLPTAWLIHRPHQDTKVWAIWVEKCRGMNKKRGERCGRMNKKREGGGCS